MRRISQPLGMKPNIVLITGRLWRLWPSLITAALALTGTLLGAQEPKDDQRAYVKKQVQFDRWQDLTKSRPETRSDTFKVEQSLLAPWQIRRVREIGKANHGVTTQYILSKADKPSSAKEVLRVSVTRCATRADAEEGLIDHLSGIQRADVKLIEEESLLLGDLAVHIPGTPEAAIYFVRGNVLVCVENAGEKPAAELREVTRKIDQSLKSVAR